MNKSVSNREQISSILPPLFSKIHSYKQKAVYNRKISNTTTATFQNEQLRRKMSPESFKKAKNSSLLDELNKSLLVNDLAKKYKIETDHSILKNHDANNIYQSFASQIQTERSHRHRLDIQLQKQSHELKKKLDDAKTLIRINRIIDPSQLKNSKSLPTIDKGFKKSQFIDPQTLSPKKNRIHQVDSKNQLQAIKIANMKMMDKYRMIRVNELKQELEQIYRSKLQPPIKN